MVHGWHGDKVRLVPLDRERHLDNALKWFNDPEVTSWTVTGDWPMTRGMEEEFFRTADSEDRSNLHFAVESLQGEHVGFTGILRIDWQSRVGVTGSIIGRSDLWGKGLGTDSARVRARYAFDVLGLRMLIAEVMAGNDGSLKMLANAGYTEVARIPDRYWKRGALRDQIVLVLGRPE